MTAFVRYFFNFDASNTPLNKCGAAYHLLVRCVKTRIRAKSLFSLHSYLTSAPTSATIVKISNLHKRTIQMKFKYAFIGTLALSALLYGCAKSTDHDVKNAKGRTEINLHSKKTSSSSSKSSISSSSSAKKTESEIATEPIEDADTKALTADQCIAWGTAAYAKQHHLSFADTTDLEAKVTNEDGYGYVTMFNGKKKVARYRITSKGGLYDVKLKRVISKKPIQIVLSKSNASDQSSSDKSSGVEDISNYADSFTTNHPATQEELAVMAAKALYDEKTIPDPPEKGREPGTANSRITIKDYGNGQIFLCTDSSPSKQTNIVSDSNYAIIVSGTQVKIHTLARALTQEDLDEATFFKDFDGDEKGAVLHNVFTTDQLCQTFNGQRQKIDAWIKVLKTTY